LAHFLTLTFLFFSPRYDELSQLSEEEREEETGWKLVHGDVFRTPRFASFLSILVGQGMQLIIMSIITLIFAALGFLSPANRGSLMTALLVVFVFMGFFAGYHSTRLYLMFKLPNWKSNATVTALLFPGLVFGCFFILNLFVWGEESVGAIPFGTLLAIAALWYETFFFFYIYCYHVFVLAKVGGGWGQEGGVVFGPCSALAMFCYVEWLEHSIAQDFSLYTSYVHVSRTIATTGCVFPIPW
jgi:hypothetical protein